MDWYPLWNSLRIAAISTFFIFFAGIFAAYYIAKLPRLVKGVLDVFLTLPLVLPPTVVGYLLLRVLGPKRIIGAWVLRVFGFKMVMTWWSAIFATIVVIFPLMYRTVRGAFEAFDETLGYAGQTLGIPGNAIDLRSTDCRFRVLRVIPDVAHTIMLLRPEGSAPDAPVLRVECAPEDAGAPGQVVGLSFRAEHLLVF